MVDKILVFQREFLDWFDTAHSGVIHHNVQFTKLFYSLFDHGLHLTPLAHIGLNSNSLHLTPQKPQSAVRI